MDSSASALALAEANAALNGVLLSSITLVKDDVAAFMAAALAAGRSWDVVVLDPPKLAPTKKVLDRAAAKYRRLNALAMQLTAPGGLLMTCSCSGAMTQSGTFPTVLQVSGPGCTQATAARGVTWEGVYLHRAASRGLSLSLARTLLESGVCRGLDDWRGLLTEYCHELRCFELGEKGSLIFPLCSEWLILFFPPSWAPVPSTGAVLKSIGKPSRVLGPLVQDASTMARRPIRILRHSGAGPDHTLIPGYPEGAYLTNMLLHVI